MMYCRNCGKEISNEAAICVHCGVPAGKGNTYCPNCGQETNPEAVICVSCGVPLKKQMPKDIQPRNLVTAILLSIVTCGIYGIYWFVKLTDEMNRLSGNENDTSGGMAFLLTLVTCGIYGFYWAYKMGEKSDKVTETKSSNSILYLVLALFGLSIVNYVLIQNTINKALENN